MDRRIGTVLGILEGEWQRPVDVARLADAVHMSPSHLQHMFKRTVRMSIRSFVLEKRLMHAAAQIRNSDERISIIGLAVGFADASNFNHAFKVKFGVSPREYRRRCGRPHNDVAPIAEPTKKTAAFTK